VSSAVQLPEPAAELLAVAARVTEAWLRRSVVAAVADHRVDAAGWADLDDTIATTTTQLLHRLETLLATDVDEQRTNPLSLYRSAVAAPSELLGRLGVRAPAPDAFADAHFPDDPYRLGPAAWSDVDPEMQSPGLTWGAWKAMTVLQRRQAEGQR
jgi:hypothetical protein